MRGTDDLCLGCSSVGGLSVWCLLCYLLPPLLPWWCPLLCPLWMTDLQKATCPASGSGWPPRVMHLKHWARSGLCVQRAGICADMSIYSCYIHLSSCLTCRSLWINFHVSLCIWVLLHPQPPPATCGAEDGRYLTQQCCINDLEKETLLSFRAQLWKRSLQWPAQIGRFIYVPSPAVSFPSIVFELSMGQFEKLKNLTILREQNGHLSTA